MEKAIIDDDVIIFDAMFQWRINLAAVPGKLRLLEWLFKQLLEDDDFEYDLRTISYMDNVDRATKYLKYRIPNRQATTESSRSIVPAYQFGKAYRDHLTAIFTSIEVRTPPPPKYPWRYEFPKKCCL